MGNGEYSAEYFVLATVQYCWCSAVEFTDLYWNFHGKKSQTYLWIYVECCSYTSE